MRRPRRLPGRKAWFRAGAILWLLLLLTQIYRWSSTSLRDREWPRVNGPTTIRVRLGAAGPAPWTLRRARSRSEEAGLLGDVLPTEAPLIRIETRKGHLHVGGRDMGREFVLDVPEPGVEIDVNGKTLIYHGRLAFSAEPDARPVLTLPLEDYLAQVLPREMPISYPEAALEAQAIAARSYAAAQVLRTRRRAFDVVDDEFSQVFGSVDHRTPRARSIVNATRGIVLSYGGRVLPGFFSANCGGHTRPAGDAFGGKTSPPLSGVPCAGCGWSKDFRWSTRVPLSPAVRRLGLSSRPDQVRVHHFEGDPWRSSLVFELGGSRSFISARRLRRALGRRRIRSLRLKGASLQHGDLILSGRGFGHGVGLCQQGARGYAERGWSAEDILSHYYPEAVLAILAP